MLEHELLICSNCGKGFTERQWWLYARDNEYTIPHCPNCDRPGWSVNGWVYRNNFEKIMKEVMKEWQERFK